MGRTKERGGYGILARVTKNQPDNRDGAWGYWIRDFPDSEWSG